MEGLYYIVMATPPIPPRPVSYVSSVPADGEDQANGNVT